MAEKKPCEKEAWIPSTEEERQAIRLQLESVLQHPLFLHSQRYPALLRYVVEQAVAGTVEHIKERTIGVLVFGRNPSYDANADPVVRVTAGRIRKRLTQYYSEADHHDEIRIVLPTGSYIPQLFRPSTPAPENPPQEEAGFQAPVIQDLHVPVRTHNSVLRRSRQRVANWMSAGVSVSVLLGSLLFVSWKFHAPDARDQFWNGISDSPGPISLCIEPDLTSEASNKDVNASTNDPNHMLLSAEQVGWLLRVASAAPKSEGRFRILHASATSFEALRLGPLVLVAEGSNPWVVRLTSSLRFALLSEPGRLGVVDRTNRGMPGWFTPKAPLTQPAIRSYALIARYRDSTLGQPTVILAGIGPGGTAAGIETVTDSRLLESFLKRAPKNCSDKNLEMVVGADVIDGFAGAPQLLAAHCW